MNRNLSARSSSSESPVSHFVDRIIVAKLLHHLYVASHDDREKAKEIAILKALGPPTGRSWRTFMSEGMIIGGIGRRRGSLKLRCRALHGLAWSGLRLDPDVYYVDRLPMRREPGGPTQPSQVATLTICTLAVTLPAKQAAQRDPSTASCYE